MDSTTKKPTRPPTQVVGNLSNQKYEAVCNVRHHFESILSASPSKEVYLRSTKYTRTVMLLSKILLLDK